MNSGQSHELATEAPQRRSFLMRLVASVVAIALALFPFAAGWGVLFHPLRRGPGKIDGDDPLDVEKLVRICPLDSLPADGMPHQFVVVADVADAWTRDVGQRVGSVFLTRTEVSGKPRVTAFTATCPHLGCAVDFDAADGRFECPCHESGFAKDGERLFGPSSRGLDPLAVELVDKDGHVDVWIAYKKFHTGIPERKPIG